MTALRVYPEKGQPGVNLQRVHIGQEGLDGDRRKGAPVHVVSQQAIGDDEPPRANVFLDLGDERDWIGRTVQVGSAVLLVDRAPKHCLGVYAEVITPGTVQLGSDCHLVEP